MKQVIIFLTIIITSTLFMSCDNISKESGTFSVNFSWAVDKNGKEIKPDFSGNEFFITVRIYEWKGSDTFPGDITVNGRQLLQSEPVLMKTSGTDIDFKDLSYGDNRFIVAEIRKGADLNGSVLFFGMSSLFELKVGKHTKVNVEMSMTPTPGVNENGEIVETELRIVDSAGNVKSYTNSNDIKVNLQFINALNFSKIYIAGKEEFLKTENGGEYDIEDLTELEEENCFSLNELWDLSKGLSSDELSVAPELKVYARMENDYGKGITLLSRIALDDTRPLLVLDINPVYTNGSSTINLNISANELIKYDSIEIEADNTDLSFKCPPQINNESLSFTCYCDPAKISDGEYEVKVSASDQAGNKSENSTVLTIDKVDPQLTFSIFRNNEKVDNDQIFLKENDSLQIDLKLSKEPVETPKVRLGGTDIGCEGSAGFTYTCAAVIGKTDFNEGIADLNVYYSDKAGNIFNNVIVSGIRLDFTPPEITLMKNSSDIYNATDQIVISVFSNEQLSEIEINGESSSTDTISWTINGINVTGTHNITVKASDMAGNPFAETTIGSYEVDAQYPEASLNAPDPARISGTGTTYVTVSPTNKGLSQVKMNYAECTPLDDTSFECTYTPTAGSSDETIPLNIEISDEVGNKRSYTAGTVYVDRTEPQVSSAGFKADSRFPYPVDSDKVTYYFSRIEPESDKYNVVYLTIYSSEKMQDPKLFSEDGTVEMSEWSLNEVAENKVVFKNIFTEIYPVGDTLNSFTVEWEDDLGNRGKVPLNEKFMMVEDNSPEKSDIFIQNIVLSRVPWGRDGSDSRPELYIKPKTPQLITVTEGSEISMISVYDSNGGILGSIEIDENGSFEEKQLNSGDELTVFLNPVNRYGVKQVAVNSIADITDSDMSSVTEIEWTATMNGKSAGSAIVNPHKYYKGKFSGALNNIISEDNEISGPEKDTSVTREWIKMDLSTEKPTSGLYYSAVYDSVGGKLISAGGSYATTFEMWEWDGKKWASIPNENGPVNGEGHILIYDRKNGNIVMFGLSSLTNNSEDTWLWDGTKWTELDLETNPPERSSHAMAYDSESGITLLFAGMPPGPGGASYALDDLWKWDGKKWEEFIVAGEKPVKRSSHAIAYDEKRKVAVLFGGNSEAGYLNDTWEWNGTFWKELEPADSPTGRIGHKMAYDRKREKIILYGGRDSEGYPNDTWEWDGTEWKEVQTLSHPATMLKYSMDYDHSVGKVVLFGGQHYDSGTTYYTDIWYFDGTDWEMRSVPDQTPTPRKGHSLSLNSSTGNILLFGGTVLSGSNLNDTWEWNGYSWNKFEPANSPTVRAYHATAYDPTRNVTILFGGSEKNDTWEFDGETWTQIFPTHIPEERSYHSLAFDPQSGKVLLFGGHKYETVGIPRHIYMNDLWSWDGSDWTELTPADGPSGRQSSFFGYDSFNFSMLLFGGREESSGTNDTWNFDGSEWNQLDPHTVPEKQYSIFGCTADIYPMIFSTDCEKSWLWNGSDWEDYNINGSVGERGNTAMEYDLHNNNILMFGGHVGGSVVNDTFLLENGYEKYPVQIFAVNFRAAYMDENGVIKKIDIELSAGGTGNNEGTPADGIRLFVWDMGKWTQISSETWGNDSPGTLSVTIDDVNMLNRLLYGEEKEIFVLVRTAYPSGSTDTFTKLTVEKAEVTVHYTLAP